jgi:DNA replication and repair protein RecF
MLLKHLSLAYFRNYRRLDLTLEPGLNLFWGDNGQGKSNLLEAAYLLATARSFRTSAERDLINWHADTTPLFARVAGEITRSTRTDRIEVVVAATDEAARRRARINGQDKPLSHLLGHLNAVLFSPEDVDLVAGPAERRRRYLDITLCQVNPIYLRNLRRFLRVLSQRNALLKLARERAVPPDEFEYWDSQLTASGASLLVTRLVAIHSLNAYLADIYPRLTHENATLRLDYRSTIDLGGADLSPALLTSESRAELEHELASRFARRLAENAARERAQAVTLSGVHRDDAAFIADGVDLRTFGSRGQQRTAALALRLAETAFMRASTGETPILLLDDVMSELDPSRRQYLQRAIAGHDHVLLTATDLASFDPDFLAGARRFRVSAGQVTNDT